LIQKIIRTKGSEKQAPAAGFPRSPEITVMKKKVSSVARKAKAELTAHREAPYFCDLVPATHGASAIEGIALRVIMTDIRKHKTSGNAPENTTGAEGADKI
jgi:hypothetical protein